jgi:selenocysteine lyase/cysteine desulfurase
MGGYEAERQAHDKIVHTYQSLATLINCTPEEIAIVENATRAWDMAFYAMAFEPGDKVLTSQAEYASNYIAFLQRQKQRGIEIIPIPNDSYGQLDVVQLEAAIDSRVKLIAVTHIPTNGGLVNPAQKIGEIARRHHIPYLLDACQSIGQMSIDVEAIGCDMLSATSRKFLRGPRGVGFLYVKQAMLQNLDPPFLDLHAATWQGRDSYSVQPNARKFETWESHVAGKIALGTACDYALAWGLPEIYERVQALASLLRAQLNIIPGIRTCDLGLEQCGIVSIAAPKPEELMLQLSTEAINVSVSSQAYTLLDMQQRGLQQVLRASVHYYNTETEVEQFCDLLAKKLAKG